MLISAAIGIQRTILSLFTEKFSDFQSNVMAAAITLSVFGITKSLGNFLGGVFSDVKGRKIISVIGNSALIVGTVSILFLDNLAGFVLGNFFVGIGTGLVFVAATILLTDLASLDERSTAVSFMELSVYFGTALGSVTTLNIEISKDNIVPYYLSGAILVVGLGFLLFTVRDTQKYIRRESKIEREDSRVKRVFEMFYKDFGLDEESLNLSNGTPLPDTHRYYLKPTFQVVLGSGIVTRIIDSLIIIILPLMILNLGMSSFQYSVVSTVYLLSWSSGILMAIPVTKLHGRKLPIMLGLIVQAFGIILFTISSFFPVLITAAVLAGLGLGVYYPLPGSIVTDIVPAEKRGQAVGIFRLFLDFGYFIGSVLWVLSTDYVYDWAHTRLFLFGSYDVYSFNFLVGFSVLLFHSVMILLFLKDTRPIWKQKPVVLKHFENVKKVFDTIEKDVSFTVYEDLDIQATVREAKVYERKADDYLDYLTKETYAGSFPLIDSYDILRFCTRVDKAAGHVIRSMRKLDMLSSPPPQLIFGNIQKYLKILDVLVESLHEALGYLSVGISISVFRSYQVSVIEEVLDEIYRILWTNLKELSDRLDPFEIMILKDVIDSLEKSANTIDDASELLRVIAFKHLA